VDAMSSLEQVASSPSSLLTATADGDMMAFISSLIEQNAELTQKLNELTSQKKLADEIVAEAHQKADIISLLAEKEANRRAASVISESEEKAGAEVDRIVAEATQRAEAIKDLKEKEANDRATAIISESEAKARIEADRIIAEAKEQAHAIIEEEKKKAQQYGLLIIDKAREKAISILEEANAELSALASKAGEHGRH